jgi:hypothetical protein
MHRLAWITAARIVEQHRSKAVEVVREQLDEVEKDRSRGAPSEDELKFWCATARAMLEILRATREVGEVAH